MAERREGAMSPCCCLPWRDLLLGCLGAPLRRADADLLSRCTICLCGRAIYTLPCGHSLHHRPRPRFPRCPVCHSREDDGAPPLVCSAAAALGKQEPLVLLPPPPSRLVHSRAKHTQEQEQPPSPSPVQFSGMQEPSSSPPPPP